MDRLSFGNASSDDFDRASDRCIDWTFAIERVSKRIENATDNRVTGWNAEEGAEGSDFIPFTDAQVVPENDDPDRFFFEVERQSDHAAGKFDHFARHDARQSVNACDPIADFENGSDFSDIDLAAELLDLFLNDGCDFIRVKLHLINLVDGHAAVCKVRLL
jgi:hypothetical protein